MNNLFLEDEDSLEKIEITPWTIENDSQADWAIEMIKAAKDKQGRFVAHYQNQIKRINEEAQHTIDYFTGKLSQYYIAQAKRGLVKEAKTQGTLALPSGKVIYTFPKEDFEHDDDKLLEYLQKNDPDYVKTETVSKPKWGEYKKLLTIKDGNVINKETGEIIKAVSVISKPGTFTVKEA